MCSNGKYLKILRVNEMNNRASLVKENINCFFLDVGCSQTIYNNRMTDLNHNIAH